MLSNEKSKIRIAGLLFLSLVAMAVYRNDTVGILVYDSASGVHTEGSYSVAVLLGTVYYLTLVKLVGYMRENLSRKLYAYSYINSV